MSDTDKELSHLEKLEARMAKLRMQIAKKPRRKRRNRPRFAKSEPTA